MKATTLKQAVATLVRHDLSVAKCLRPDRDWLWLVGDYKEAVETRAVLKDTGFRFSRKGRDLESGETAHWYFCASLRTRVKAARAAAKAVKPAVKAEPAEPAVSPSLLVVGDPGDEFTKMFG
jgi:hypothetical protein